MRRALELVAVGSLLAAAPALAQGDAPVSTTTTTTTTTSNTDRPAKAPPLAVDEGWNTPWSMLFSLNNIFVNGSFFSSPVDGTLGADYRLSSHSALRGGVSFSRTTNPAQVTKVVTQSGDQTIATYSVTNPGGYTEQDVVNVRVEYLYRLLQGPLSPYFGGGGQVGWTLTRQSYTDSQSTVGQSTQIYNNTSTVSIAARAVAGAEWRFHPNFAVYADYNVTLTIYQNSHLSNQTTVNNTVGGVTSSARTTTTQNVDSFLGVSTAVNQAASLGLEVFFN